jgi:hypothetical protein
MREIPPEAVGTNEATITPTLLHHSIADVPPATASLVEEREAWAHRAEIEPRLLYCGEIIIEHALRI